MKRCKDCKWQRACYNMLVFYSERNMDIERTVEFKCQRNNMSHYHRKWWKFWRQK